jgi:hypothetical protein
VLHTSEDPGRPIAVDRPKVEGGRVVAERRHVPIRSRPAGRMPTRSRRSQGRHGFTWRRGERSSSSRRLARGGRNGPPGHEGPEARSEEGSGGAKPRRATAAGGRFGDRGRYGFAGGSRLRSSRSRNVATPGWASRVRAPRKPRLRGGNGVRAPVGNQATASQGAGVGETRSEKARLEPRD